MRPDIAWRPSERVSAAGLSLFGVLNDAINIVDLSSSLVPSPDASSVSDNAEDPCVCKNTSQRADVVSTVLPLGDCNGETQSSVEGSPHCSPSSNNTLAMFADLTAGLKPNHLLFLTCKNTGIKFCVDTGSCINIIKPSDLPPSASIKPSHVKVYGVGSGHASTQCEVQLQLQCGDLPDKKRTTCVVADTPLNLLGFPYVCEHGFEQLQQFATVESIHDHVA